MLSGPMPSPLTERIAIEVAFAGVPSKSVSAPMQPATVGPGKHGASSASPSPLGPGVKCPISMAKIDIHLQRRPRDEVVELGGVVFRIETEIRRRAGVRIGVLKAVGSAGHHEPGLVRGQVLDHCQKAG